jgi:hypothetical protein
MNKIKGIFKLLCLTESYIIGTFNDFAYRGKVLEFMIRKVIKNLLKVETSFETASR